MLKKITFMIALILSGVFLALQSFNLIKYYSKENNDQQITVINQKLALPNSISRTRLLTGDKVTFGFTAKHDNLGTIEVLFDTNGKINEDWLWFRIKERGSKIWYYENKYKTDQFNDERFFPFGFPLIENSKNKNYLIEIESIYGIRNDSVSVNKNSNNFYAKYSFSRSYLSENKIKTLNFIKERIIIYLSYIPFSKAVQITFYSVLPLLAWLIAYSKVKFKINKKAEKLIEKMFPGLVFLITVIVSGYFSLFNTDPHHDGILIKPALDLLNGNMLFRDTFTQYGALTTILQSSALKLFGKYLLTIKLETAFFYSFTSVLLYHIWSRFIPKKFAFLSTIILLLLAPYYIFTFLPWSSVYALFFQCLTLYLLLKNQETKKFHLLFFAGVTTALTFWSKQNIGAYVVVPAIIYLVITELFANNKKGLKSKLLYYFFGGISASLIFLIWITLNGALTDWWKQSIVMAANFIETKSKTNFIGSLFPGYVHPAYIGYFTIWAILPLSALIAFVYSLHNLKTQKTVMAVSLFGLFSWLQYYPITDIRHTFWASAPFVGIFIYLILKLSESITLNRKLNKYIVFLFFLWLFFYPDINFRINSALQKMKSDYFYLNKPEILKGMRLNKEEYDFYKNTFSEISNYKKINGEVNFITNSPNALYLTFADSTNFHPLYADFGNSIYPDYYLIKNDYIEKNKPLIMSIWGQIHPGYCRINNITNSSDTAFLIAPCENVSQSE